MEIIRRSEASKGLTPMDPAHFTGPAGSRELIKASTDTRGMFAAVVRFEAGVRNHWHAHAGGQLLHVIEGDGWVQLRGQEPSRLQLGDIVTAGPGEEHWHGAGRLGPMAHLAVGIGETRWLEASPEPPE